MDQDEQGLAFVDEVNNGSPTIPTTAFPDGDAHVEPSSAELARKLVMQTRASSSFYYAIIVLGGSTGLTAATCLYLEGVDTLVIQRGGSGGRRARLQPRH